MKGLKLIAVSFLILLVFACFISVPVFGENPWDADGGGGSGSDSDTDTTGTEGDGSELETLTGGELGDEFDADWLTGLLFQFSYRILTGFLMDSQTASTPQQVAAN